MPSIPIALVNLWANCAVEIGQIEKLIHNRLVYIFICIQIWHLVLIIHVMTKFKNCMVRRLYKKIQFDI